MIHVREEVEANPEIVEAEPQQVSPLGVSLRAERMMHLVFLAIAAAIILLSFLMSSVGESMVFLPGASLPMPDT
ncbi:MAG: hypothetical protein AAF456_09395 [Planctomycetota bacterium]